MEIALRSLLFLVLIFTFFITLLDINKSQTMKQEIFESLRAATQNGLLEVKDAYDNYEILQTPQLLEEWLIGFVNNHSIDQEDLRIGFVQINTEPPYYIVSIEGYMDDYALVSKDAYIKYVSSAMIVSDNIEKE